MYRCRMQQPTHVIIIIKAREEGAERNWILKHSCVVAAVLGA